MIFVHPSQRDIFMYGLMDIAADFNYTCGKFVAIYKFTMCTQTQEDNVLGIYYLSKDQNKFDREHQY